MVTGSRFLTARRRRLPLVGLAPRSASASSPASCRCVTRRRVTDPDLGLPHDRPPRHRAVRPRLPARLPRGRGGPAWCTPTGSTAARCRCSMRERTVGPLVDRLDAVGLLHDQGAAGRASSGCCARGPTSTPATTRPSPRSTRSDGRRASRSSRSSSTGGLFFLVFELVRRRRLMERYALLWLFATAVLLGLAVWRGAARADLRRGRASPTRRRRCSRSRSGSCSCCCCTSRSSSRAWPTRTRCWPRSWACCSSASTQLEAEAGAEAEAGSEQPRGHAGPDDHALTCMRLPRSRWSWCATTAPASSRATLDGAARRSSRRTTRSSSSTTPRATARAGGRARTARRGRPSSKAAENLGFAGGCHAGAARRRAAARPVAQPRRRAGARVPRRAARLRRASDPSWGAWQALVTLAGGRAREHGRQRRALARLRLGRARSARPVASVDAAPREVGFASGAALVVRREAWDAVGRLRRALLHVRRGSRPLAAPAAGGLGRRHRAARRASAHDYEFAKGDYKWF